MNKYFKVLIGLITMMFLISNSYSVMTYVGVEILNLTDDPSYSCAGLSDYGSQGRIRAIASIAGHHPIYFNLSKVSDGSTVWSGDDTSNSDYTIGDTFYVPTAVDLTISENYNLFFDINALRIYLNMGDYVGVTRSGDDNYWTAGMEATGCVTLSDVNCVYTGTACSFTGAITFSKTRDQTLGASCTGRMIIHNSATHFQLNSAYNDLNTASVGNINLAFTYS